MYGHDTSRQLFNSILSSTPEEQHQAWLKKMRNIVAWRTTFEEGVPSFTSLWHQWLRSCWISQLNSPLADLYCSLPPPVQSGGVWVNRVYELLEILWYWAMITYNRASSLGVQALMAPNTLNIPPTISVMQLANVSALAMCFSQIHISLAMQNSAPGWVLIKELWPCMGQKTGCGRSFARLHVVNQ